jgi:hypothetical protein
MCLALTVVFFAASGFVVTNASTGTELRGDRVTSAVALAQQTADTITESREDECRERGDRCRALEEQERQALTDLAAARAEVRAMADPQAQALHVDSNTVRTVQAAAIRDVPGCRLHHCVRCRIDLAAELTLSVAAVRIVQAERIGFFGVPPPKADAQVFKP